MSQTGVLDLRPTDSLGAAVACVLASKSRGLPATDDDRQVIGMVSCNDVMQAIARAIS